MQFSLTKGHFLAPAMGDSPTALQECITDSLTFTVHRSRIDPSTFATKEKIYCQENRYIVTFTCMQ